MTLSIMGNVGPAFDRQTLCLSPGSLKAPYDADDLPEDLEVLLAPADLDGGHGGVFRLQDDHVLLEGYPLDGGLVVEQGHHDVSVLGRGLAPDQGVIPWQDVGADHAIALHLEEKDHIPVHPVAGDGEGSLHVLLGEEGFTRGDPADDGQLPEGGGRPAGRGLSRSSRLQNLQGSGLRGDPAKVALPLQRLEMVKDTARDEAEMVADFPDRGWIAGPVQEVANEVEDLALSGC